MRRPKRRHTHGFDPGPMADIAFMMLIFFMVTTAFEKDWGISLRLPPWTEEESTYPPDEMPIPFRIDINSKNKIMANDKIIEASEIKLMCKLFLKNNLTNSLPAVVQFRTNRHSSYKVYISVLDEIKATFNELWNEESQRLFNKEYRLTSRDQKRIIRNKYPFEMMEHESDIYLYTY